MIFDNLKCRFNCKMTSNTGNQVCSKFEWYYEGFDNGKLIYSTPEKWTKFEDYKSSVLEKGYLKGEIGVITNGGEYSFDLKNMSFYVIDFGFVSEKINIKRVKVDS